MTPPDPGPVLAMWAGGIAGGAALVALWKIVGRGFVILAVAVVVLVGAAGAATGGGVWAWAACALALLAAAVPRLAAPALAAAAVIFVVVGAGVTEAGFAGALASTTGAVALGGVTAEMLLGHWYLVDPRLPRWALRNLALAGLAGVVVDGILVWLGIGADPFVSPLILIALMVTSAGLLVAVVLALRVPSYTGVMAATGLSYLAVLTTLGAVVVGRAVAG